MNAGDLRRRRAELRRSLAIARQRARARVRELPLVRRLEEKRRRRRRAAWVILLLLLLFLGWCQQDDPAAPEPGPASVEKKVGGPGARRGPNPVRPAVNVAPRKRPRYQAETARTPTWLQELQLQVGSRSPRLASCFTGSERPGSLRWSASVNVANGAVADHEIEPLGQGGLELRRPQRDCVIQALSDPPYRLPVTPGQSVPARVSLVIEF